MSAFAWIVSGIALVNAGVLLVGLLNYRTSLKTEREECRRIARDASPDPFRFGGGL